VHCAQAKLTAEQLAELPVPLLAEHAVALGAPRSSGQLVGQQVGGPAAASSAGADDD
jgi:hypothetical protein